LISLWDIVDYRVLSRRLTARLNSSTECVSQPSTVDNVKATVPWKSRDHGGRWCMDGYLFDCRHERNTFLSSVQRRLSGGSVRSSRLTRRSRDKSAELVPLGREIDDCQVETLVYRPRMKSAFCGDQMSSGLSRLSKRIVHSYSIHSVMLSLVFLN